MRSTADIGLMMKASSEMASEQRMRLADFIEKNAQDIVEGAGDFARTQAPPGLQLDTAALQNDFPRILAAVVIDLRTSQAEKQQRAKSEGRAPAHIGPESGASSHGRLRARDGFDVNHMVAEFRALRAAVLRLWATDAALTQEDIEDMVRFNEAVDQAIAESLVDFSKQIDSWRHMFLGVLGHDLRGPLSAIVATSELMARKTTDTALAALAERMTKSGVRMGKLLDNLLVYNKTELGVGIHVDLSPCDLAVALQEEVELLQAALPKARVSFEAEGPSQGLFDTSLIREALHNLVTNASKYGDPDAEIQVSLLGGVEGVQLTVCNAGSPISARTLNSMFEPMRRGDQEAASGEEASLGLGLFVVRQIVNAHRGDVTVSSAEGKTKFTVWLPVKGEDASQLRENPALST